MDDEPALRAIFGAWLRNAGCTRLHLAADGLDALALCETTPVNLLITDIRMPRLDGVGLIRRLRESHSGSPSIIFVSGFGEIDAREVYALGVETCLTKPLPREHLLAAVESALADRGELWLQRFPQPPRQSILVEVDGVNGGGWQLGRGGFSLRYAEPLSLTKVAFDCVFPHEGQRLAGEGYVRWVSRAENTAGIEFAYVEPESRRWLVEQISRVRSPSFIPKL